MGEGHYWSLPEPGEVGVASALALDLWPCDSCQRKKQLNMNRYNMSLGENLFAWIHPEI